MKELRKIVEKTGIDRIRSQQIGESYGIQSVNEWVERRRREWNEVTKIMDAERLYLPEDDLQDVRKEDEGT